MTSAGVKVKEKTKNQENLLTLALPNQSNAVIYYITSAFRFSSQTQKGKTNENRPRRSEQHLILHRVLCVQGLTPVCVKIAKKCAARIKPLSFL